MFKLFPDPAGLTAGRIVPAQEAAGNRLDVRPAGDVEPPVRRQDDGVGSTLQFEDRHLPWVRLGGVNGGRFDQWVRRLVRPGPLRVPGVDRSAGVADEVDQAVTLLERVGVQVRPANQSLFSRGRVVPAADGGSFEDFGFCHAGQGGGGGIRLRRQLVDEGEAFVFQVIDPDNLFGWMGIEERLPLDVHDHEDAFRPPHQDGPLREIEGGHDLLFPGFEVVGVEEVGHAAQGGIEVLIVGGHVIEAAGGVGAPAVTVVPTVGRSRAEELDGALHGVQPGHVGVLRIGVRTAGKGVDATVGHLSQKPAVHLVPGVGDDIPGLQVDLVDGPRVPFTMWSLYSA